MESKQSVSKETGILLLLGVGVLAFVWFQYIKRNSTPIARQVGWVRQEGPPVIKPQNSYDNEEVREISYNEDGLPIRIVITRHAKVG